MKLCPCGKEVYTFIAHIPACKGCYEAYRTEGMEYLPNHERKVFHGFIDRARLVAEPSALGYTFDGY